MDKASLESVNQFLDISKENNSDTARYYLEIADQDIEKAINLYYQDVLKVPKDQETSQSNKIVTRCCNAAGSDSFYF